jgi:hypothetical protein
MKKRSWDIKLPSKVVRGTNETFFAELNKIFSGRNKKIEGPYSLPNNSKTDNIRDEQEVN